MAELMTERVWGRGLGFPRREKGDRKWTGKNYFGGRIVTFAYGMRDRRRDYGRACCFQGVITTVMRLEYHNYIYNVWNIWAVNYQLQKLINLNIQWDHI